MKPQHAFLEWDADCARYRDETLDAVRATSQEQVPFNVHNVGLFSDSLLRVY